MYHLRSVRRPRPPRRTRKAERKAPTPAQRPRPVPAKRISKDGAAPDLRPPLEKHVKNGTAWVAGCHLADLLPFRVKDGSARTGRHSQLFLRWLTGLRDGTAAATVRQSDVTRVARSWREKTILEWRRRGRRSERSWSHEILAREGRINPLFRGSVGGNSGRLLDQSAALSCLDGLAVVEIQHAVILSI